MERKSKRIFLIGMALLLCLQMIVLFYYGCQKSGYHEDELYSYYSSNKTAGLFVNDREWTEGKSFKNELVVLPGEQFRYSVVKQMQSWDVHPPLYYYLLHTVCSLTPGIFSKWQGISVNMVGFVISFVLLAYAAYLVGIYPASRLPETSIEERQTYRKRGFFLAAAVCTIWGFGGAVISGVMFIRMYQWLTVFVLLCLCLHLRQLVLQKESLWFYVLLAITVFLGFLTQYYYIIFHFFLGAGFCLYLLKQKKWKSVAAYAAACAAGLGAAILYYPAALSHIFRGYRGTEAVGEFTDASNTLERLQFFGDLFNQYMMGSILAILLLVICLVAVTRRFLRKRSGEFFTLPVILLMLAAAGYFFTVAKTALLLGETSNRYELPIYGLLVVLLVYGVYMLLKPVAVLTMAVLLVVLNLTGNTVFFLYSEEAQMQEFVRQNKETPVIVLYNDTSESHIWWLLDELSEYENIYMASISGEGGILTDESFIGLLSEGEEQGTAVADGEIIVYMADCDNQEEELQQLLGIDLSEDSCTMVAEKDMWKVIVINGMT